MSKVAVIIVLFLVFGGMLIYTETQNKTEFATSFGKWVFHLVKNIKSVASDAITGYSWLPKTNTTEEIKNGD